MHVQFRIVFCFQRVSLLARVSQLKVNSLFQTKNQCLSFHVELAFQGGIIILPCSKTRILGDIFELFV